MCTISTAVSAAATVIITAVAQIAQAKADKAESNFQTELIQQEIQEQKDDAGYERQTGIEEARRKKLQSILNAGKEKVSTAARNISVLSGSFLNIENQEKLNGELSALITLKDSEKRAENHERQVNKLYAQAALGGYKSDRNYNNRISDITTKAATGITYALGK